MRRRRRSTPTATWSTAVRQRRRALGSALRRTGNQVHPVQLLRRPRADRRLQPELRRSATPSRSSTTRSRPRSRSTSSTPTATLRLPRRRPPAGDRLRLRRQRPGAVGLHQRRSSEIRLRPQSADNTFDNGAARLRLGRSTDSFRLQGRRRSSRNTPSTPARSAALPNWSVPALPAGTTLADLTTSIGLDDLSVGAGNDATWLIPDIDAFDRALRHLQQQRHLRGQRPRGRRARQQPQRGRSATRASACRPTSTPRSAACRCAATSACARSRPTQTSTGFATVGSAPALTTVKRSYDDTLPSLNLVADITPDFLIRFGGGEGDGAPGPGQPHARRDRQRQRRQPHGDRRQSRCSIRSAPRPPTWASSGTSPRSRCWRWACSTRTSTPSCRPRARRVRTTPPACRTACSMAPARSPTDDFQFNIPVNTPGRRRCKGLEFTYQQPFTFLPGFWSDFGVQLNYTYVDSQIQYVTSTGATSLRDRPDRPVEERLQRDALLRRRPASARASRRPTATTT